MIHLQALNEVCARMARGEDCLDWLLQAEQQLLADMERLESLAAAGDYELRSQEELRVGRQGLQLFHQSLDLLLQAECPEDLEAALDLARCGDEMMGQALEQNQAAAQLPFCDILN